MRSPVSASTMLRLLARVVDEQLLAGAVHLAHRERWRFSQRGSARRTACSRSRRGAARGTRGAAAAASRRPCAARCGASPGRAAARDVGRRPGYSRASSSSSLSASTAAQSSPAALAAPRPRSRCRRRRRARARSRGGSASAHFCRRISRVFRMDSRSVAIEPPRRRSAAGPSNVVRATSDHRRSGNGLTTDVRRSPSPVSVIGMPGFGDRHARFR